MRRTVPLANMSPAVIYIKTVVPRTLGAVLPPAMSPRPRGAGGKSSVRIGPLNDTDVFVSASEEYCEINCHLG